MPFAAIAGWFFFGFVGQLGRNYVGAEGWFGELYALMIHSGMMPAGFVWGGASVAPFYKNRTAIILACLYSVLLGVTLTAQAFRPTLSSYPSWYVWVSVVMSFVTVAKAAAVDYENDPVEKTEE